MGNGPVFADLPSQRNGIFPKKYGEQDLEANLFTAYRNIAAHHSDDYAEAAYKGSKDYADFNKKISQALYDVFMS